MSECPFSVNFDSMSSPKKKKKTNNEQQTRSTKKTSEDDGWAWRWSPSMDQDVYDVSEVDGSDEEGAGEAASPTSTRSQCPR